MKENAKKEQLFPSIRPPTKRKAQIDSSKIHIPTQGKKFNILFNSIGYFIFSNALQFLVPQGPERTQWGCSVNIPCSFASFP